MLSWSVKWKSLTRWGEYDKKLMLFSSSLDVECHGNLMSCVTVCLYQFSCISADSAVTDQESEVGKLRP